MFSWRRVPSEVRSRASPIDDFGRVGELLEAAEEPDPDALGAQLVGLVADRLAQQLEQARDLVVGAGPVLAAERVQGEHRDPAPDGVLEQPADGLDPRGVPLELGLAVGTGPATVAVHDDRDVAGQVLGRRDGDLRTGRGDLGGLARRALVGEGRRVRRPGQRSIERRLGH